MQNLIIVSLLHLSIFKAIANCQSVYSDVVKKEIVAFKEQFKDFLEKKKTLI